MNEYGQPQHDFQQPQVALPNATAVLILGIVGIITCCCWGGGGILSVIALVLASKDMKRYRANPFMYTKNSYNNLSAGRICAIIALVFSALYVAGTIWAGLMFGWNTLGDPDALREALEKYQ